MAVNLPEDIYIYLCTIPPNGDIAPFPTGCELRGPFKSSVLAEPSGYTKEQYDAIFGAVISIVVTILIVALIKKAIEQ